MELELSGFIWAPKNWLKNSRRYFIQSEETKTNCDSLALSLNHTYLRANRSHLRFVRLIVEHFPGNLIGHFTVPASLCLNVIDLAFIFTGKVMKKWVQYTKVLRNVSKCSVYCILSARPIHKQIVLNCEQRALKIWR